MISLLVLGLAGDRIDLTSCPLDETVFADVSLLTLVLTTDE